MQRTVQPSAKVSARTDRPANLHDPHGQLEDESRRQLGQSCDVNAPRLPQRRQPLACTMDSRAAPDQLGWPPSEYSLRSDQSFLIPASPVDRKGCPAPSSDPDGHHQNALPGPPLRRTRKEAALLRGVLERPFGPVSWLFFSPVTPSHDS